MTTDTSSTKRVLLIDDDAGVRRIVSRILQRKGLAVHECSTATEGLETVAADPGAFDVIVTDAVMPDLSGPEAARRFKALAPTLAIVFISGFCDEDLQLMFGRRPAGQFLQKPFQPAELMSAIMTALEAQEMAA
jgi:two-component system, cell cycle sensor histidine kinase and response regulator CckA